MALFACWMPIGIYLAKTHELGQGAEYRFNGILPLAISDKAELEKHHRVDALLAALAIISLVSGYKKSRSAALFKRL